MNDATMFLIICGALVLFMTPGLAFFYGGLVRASSVVSMMMMSFGSIGLIGILWILYGYAISFANAGTGNFVGLDGIDHFAGHSAIGCALPAEHANPPVLVLGLGLPVPEERWLGRVHDALLLW
jgi:ammonia channel protein AmtB